jgi:hypothetical protein
MNSKPPVLVKGRLLGLIILIAAQLLIGGIHVFFGLLLLLSENLSFLSSSVVYDVYTFFFGLLSLVFAVFLWRGEKVGWVGTVGVSFFVIVADSLTILDMPSIPGIPKLPSYAEIAYCLLVVSYLSLRHVRKSFFKEN